MTENQQPSKPLTGRRLRFANEYLVDLNATQAAIRAGYSAKTAGTAGWRLLKDVDIVEALHARKAELDAEYEHRIMGKYEVLARLSRIAAADMGDLLPVDEDGQPEGDIQSLSLAKAKKMGQSYLIKKL